MAWTYLLPRSSSIVSHATAISFTVESGTGSQFIPGPAVVSDQETLIRLVQDDVIALVRPLPFVPDLGAAVQQAVLNDKDKVRLFCGDTDSSDPQLQDEEIAAILLYRRNILRAAALACEVIAAKLARRVTYQIFQEIQEKLTEQHQNYLALAKVLDRRAATQDGSPAFPALTQMGRSIATGDITKAHGFFVRMMQEEPGTDMTDEGADPQSVLPRF